ncbi:MAG: putative lipid II flippase FtsW [Pseudomonadota bacterium]
MNSYSQYDKQTNKAMNLFDPVILGITITLLTIGLIMVASSSISIADRMNGQPLYFFYRQLLAVGLGIGIGLVVLFSPMAIWRKYANVLLLVGLILLVLVLIPGIGKVVNGSSRWISLGLFNLQVSEVVKLIFIVYLAGYIVNKNNDLTKSYKQFVPPLVLLCLVAFLLLLEPDLGAVVVIFATALGMLFIAGAPLLAFVMMIILVSIAAVLLVYFEPYRMTRFQAFINPWDDPFNSGFQLTQSLMAFGRGDWVGEGLGKSIQKLFYLPEAHTDFIFAIIAEELGMIGVIVIILLFLLLIFRIFSLAKKAFLKEKIFEAFIMFGIGIWISLQAFINIGVNMGVLPTKGLTLPFISYGGSSVMVMCITIALVLRAEYETRCSKPVSILQWSLFSLPLLNSAAMRLESR